MVMLVLLISFVKGESFSVDVCAGDTVLTEDQDNIYMNSPCYNIQFPKVYDENNKIQFYDSYNNDYFDLTLFSLKDVNDALPTQANTISFEDALMVASHDSEKVYYTFPDSSVKLTYFVKDKQVKAGIEVNNWQSTYATGRLEMRTKVHKESSASSHFTSFPAIVDGIEQPLTTESEIAGQNEFIVQTLYIGNNFVYLIQDPLYTVDYSPVPASYLRYGEILSDANSEFQHDIDVTSSVSDNLTVTKFKIIGNASNVNVTLDLETADLNGGTGWTDTADAELVTIESATPTCNQGTYCMEITGGYGYYDRPFVVDADTETLTITFDWWIQGFQTTEQAEFWIFDGSWVLLANWTKGVITQSQWNKFNVTLNSSQINFGSQMLSWSMIEAPSTNDILIIDDVIITDLPDNEGCSYPHGSYT